ncbi:hypothetical protein BDZ91DRAFT_761869 [Kalaharituber pfeilii]|nr:hypothetical protein BDZ91DRAFT_761869 [Kalaharituber pfeilii]
MAYAIGVRGRHLEVYSQRLKLEAAPERPSCSERVIRTTRPSRFSGHKLRVTRPTAHELKTHELFEGMLKQLGIYDCRCGRKSAGEISQNNYGQIEKRKRRQLPLTHGIDGRPAGSEAELPHLTRRISETLFKRVDIRLLERLDNLIGCKVVGLEMWSYINLVIKQLQRACQDIELLNTPTLHMSVLSALQQQ